MEKNKWPHAYTINGSKVQIEDAIKDVEYFIYDSYISTLSI